MSQLSSLPPKISQESTIQDSRSLLFRRNPVYKPFHYPFAFEAWQMQQRIHWLPEEVPINSDIQDWRTKLTDSEKNLLTQIFRFFTQMDVEVGGCYLDYYCHIFQPTEIKMMMASFANMETIHIAAYSYLLDSLGIPEVEYQAFFSYKEMKDKWDYMQNFQHGNTLRDLTLTLAAYAAFTEGLQLFASFAILLNFQRFNKMKGMGQIVTWSVRDETLHVHSLVKLFHVLIEEHPSLMTDSLRKEIFMICQNMVDHEDAFIDLAFEQGGVEGLCAEEVKKYVRYIADRRLVQLGLDPLYHIKENPLDWMDHILMSVEYTNFFENRATEYSKASLEGNWDDAWA